MQTPTRADAADVEFRAAFSATYPELVRYARRRVAAAEVDDVVSEVFLTAWRRWALRPDPDHPLPWLYGIAANVIRNRVRGQRRRLRLVERLARSSGPGSVPGPEPADTSVVDAMDVLSFDDREVLRLTAWERLTHAEIAQVLGCSVNAVAIRSHRAKRRLAAELVRRQESPGGGHDGVSMPEPHEGGSRG
jgi:RNA polymerase sigma-70 factor (ECF subfamily)